MKKYSFLALVIVALSWVEMSSADVAAEPDLSKIINLGQQFYENLPDIKTNLVSPTWRTSVIRTGASNVNGSAKRFRVAYAISRVGSKSPLLDYASPMVRILEMDFTSGDPTIKDVTTDGLPEGEYQACFWVAKSKPGEAGRACFLVATAETKLSMRMLVMGFEKRLIPKRKNNGEVSFGQNTEEECDGTFENQIHATGWCPWSARFDGVYTKDLSRDAQLDFKTF